MSNGILEMHHYHNIPTEMGPWKIILLCEGVEKDKLHTHEGNLGVEKDKPLPCEGLKKDTHSHMKVLRKKTHPHVNCKGVEKDLL